MAALSTFVEMRNSHAQETQRSLTLCSLCFLWLLFVRYPNMQKYDLIVIGSGPAGQRAAIQGAKIGKTVAVVEKRECIGGACINTGTIPSKTMREAVLHLSGYQYQSIYGMNYRVKDKITMA